MHVRKFGPVLNAIPLPLWAAEDGTGGAGDTGTTDQTNGQGTQTENGNGNGGGQNGSAAFDPGTAYATLDEDTRGWLQKLGLDKDPVSLAKSAYEKEKLLGGSIKVPGKDATPEERDAFLNKLGRPAKPEEYAFTPPKDLPEGLPYDADRANKLKTDLHALGLTQAQAAAIHDMYIGEIAGAHGAATTQQAEQVRVRAEKATDELEKLWGPVDGDTAKANFEMAGRVFTDVPGGQELLVELQGLGLVGPNKEVLSAPLAKAFAAMGGALFQEDNVLKGRRDVVSNPFAEGKDFNLTKQMALVKEDPDHARSLIAAAGKKPEDFGLKA